MTSIPYRPGHQNCTLSLRRPLALHVPNDPCQLTQGGCNGQTDRQNRRTIAVTLRLHFAASNTCKFGWARVRSWVCTYSVQATMQYVNLESLPLSHNNNIILPCDPVKSDSLPLVQTLGSFHKSTPTPIIMYVNYLELHYVHVHVQCMYVTIIHDELC
jgi:hypothetical protein